MNLPLAEEPGTRHWAWLLSTGHWVLGLDADTGQWEYHDLDAGTIRGLDWTDWEDAQTLVALLTPTLLVAGRDALAMAGGPR